MKKHLILLCLMSSLLCGCVPAAFVAGATAGGAIIYDNRSVKTMAEDRSTTFNTQAEINNNKDLQGTHISVATFNHIVLLVGQVQTPDQSQTAYNIANSYKNAKRVYNEISVQPVTSKSQRAKDTWITSKVITDVTTTSGLHSSQIKVVTENSVVYLMGLLTRSQGNLAAQVASKVSGVTQVVKLFEYLS